MRDVSATGYAALIREQGVVLPGLAQTEYISQRPLSLFRSAGGSLGLPVADPPDPDLGDPSTWTNVETFGASGTTPGDDTAAIQAAIDSGARLLYFPAGRYQISDTLRLRGSVERVLGLESQLEILPAFGARQAPIFRVEAGTSPFVIVERFTVFVGGSAHFADHDDDRTLALRNLEVDVGYRPAGGGEVFIEDVVGGPWLFGPDNRVWARQLNPENSGTKVDVGGGDFWVLGYKTEKPGTQVSVRNAGRAEILGGLIYPVNTLPLLEPMFVNNGGELSVVIGESAFVFGTFYELIVQETRGGVLRRLFANEIPRRIGFGWGAQLCLYVGRDSLLPAPPGPAAWWPLDETSGTAVPDRTSFGRSGTTQGGPAWVAGQQGNALRFDGTDDWVSLPNGFLGSDAGAVSLWIRLDRPATDLGMLFYGTDSTNPDADGVGPENEMHINITPDNRIAYYIRGDTGDLLMFSPTPLNDARWHHVLASWDRGGYSELFVDGRRVAFTKQTFNNFRFSASTRLGRPNAPRRFFAGEMDDVRVFDRPVTHDEAMDLYFGGLGFTNYPPRVDAGQDQTVQNKLYQRRLEGQAVDDGQPSGSTFRVRWTVESGPGGVIFQDQTSPTTLVTYPRGGRYVLRLTGDDGVASVFDEVTVNVFDPLPDPWSNKDIGETGAFGWSEFELPARFTLNGAGSDIGGFPATGCDSFHFASQPINLLSGIDIIARVESVEATNPGAKAGVMFRQDLDTGCTANAMVAVTPAQGLIFQARAGAFGGTDVIRQVPGVTAPVWVRLSRINANLLRGFYSADGVSWINLGDATVNVGGGTRFYGLAQASRTGRIGRSVFDGVRVQPTCPPDCSADGVLDVRDFSCFQNAFALGDLFRADCTRDGLLDVRDFTCFQNAFALGCP